MDNGSAFFSDLKTEKAKLMLVNLRKNVTTSCVLRCHTCQNFASSISNCTRHYCLGTHSGTVSKLHLYIHLQWITIYVVSNWMPSLVWADWKSLASQASVAIATKLTRSIVPATLSSTMVSRGTLQPSWTSVNRSNMVSLYKNAAW